VKSKISKILNTKIEIKRSVLSRFLVLCVLTILTTISQHSQANQTFKTLEKSTTGRTIVLNIGSLDGIKDKDEITILKNTPNVQSKYTTKLVAKAVAIKVLNNRSVWFCYKIFNRKLLKKNHKYILTSQEQLLRGRAAPSLKRRKIIAQNGKAKKSLKDYFKGFNEKKLVKKGDVYIKGKKISHSKGHTDADFELVDISEWTDGPAKLFERMEAGLLKQRKFFPKDLYTSPYQSEFLLRRNLDTYEKMIVNYLVRVNDPNFNYDDFYYDQILDDENPYFKKNDRNSLYSEVKEDRRKEIQAKRKLYRKLLTKGADWSNEYSDEDLSRLIYEKGIMDEEDRRRVIIARKHTYQITGYFGFNMIDNENSTDPYNTVDFKYELGVAVEYYMAKRYPKMQFFTAEFAMRLNSDAYSIGDLNAVAQEYSALGALNWYPFLLPNTIEENLFYFGISMRYGISNLSIPEQSEEGVYSLTSLPGFRVGVKYNFRSGFGIRVLLSYEKLDLSRIERNIVNDLPELVEADDLKLSIGASYYF
jgi:hypothetical protein